MMSRKDYVETARILNKYKQTISEQDYADLTDDFSFMFEKDNPNFIVDKFLEACNKWKMKMIRLISLVLYS